jgi:CheY-like chemotaxis protein
LSWEGKAILLVNDNPMWPRVVQLKLEQIGLDVTPASDGLTALNLARTRQPDIVVTDLRMDVMNGLELCKCIRSIWIIRDTPLILFSNLDMTESELAEAYKAGVNSVIPGSHDLSDLLEKIRELLS